MTTICKACNLSGHGMIHIYSHPNNIDGIFKSLTGLMIIENDCLCIPCYDDMKIAYCFRQKCLQSELLRQTPVHTKDEPNQDLRDPTEPLELLKQTHVHTKDEPNQDILDPTEPSQLITDEHTQESIEANIQQDEEDLNEREISTTSIPDRIEIKKEAINEPVESSVEITTSFILNIDINDNGELEENIIKFEETDALMIDYEELDKEEYEDDDLTEESDDTNQIAQCFTWKCTECDKSFERKVNFQKHIKIHSKSLKPNVRKKKIHTPKYAEEDIFQDLHETQCEFCFIEFDTAKERHMHEIDHQNEEKPYKCPLNDCTSHFKEKYGLRNHIRIHSDYKRYKCRYCDHRFHQRGNIISHERLHTGEKPFLCPHCGKAFAESGNLKAHIRFHTGERPYPCTMCEKSFKTHYAHKIHERTHTKERPYLCSECGKRFSSSGKLLVHKRIHTGQRPYRCGECSSAFVNSTGLKRHSKTHMSKVPKPKRIIK